MDSFYLPEDSGATRAYGELLPPRQGKPQAKAVCLAPGAHSPPTQGLRPPAGPTVWVTVDVGEPLLGMKAQLCHQGDEGLRFWAASACADIPRYEGTQEGFLWADVSRSERSRDATLDPARKVRLTLQGRA